MAKKRRFMDGGNSDPEGTADAGRGDGTAGIEGQGGFGGPDYDGGNYSGLDAALAAPSMPAQASHAADDAALLNFDKAHFQNVMEEKAARYNNAVPTSGLAALAWGVNKALGGKPATALAEIMAQRELGHDAQGNFAGKGGAAGATDPMQDYREPGYGAADPMQVGIAQTTPTAQTAGGSGERQYVWDPIQRRYVLTNLGAGANPMNYTQGQQFNMGAAPTPYLGRQVDPAYAMAAGGSVEGIAGGLQSRVVKGPGDGQSDSIPVRMDDGGQGRLADGEFVVDATTVAALGNGSSDAGARALYDMVKRIREMAHGRNDLQKPVDHTKALPA